MKKVGVVLSGCGVYDGSEVHEAVFTLLAIDRNGAEAVCMAPDVGFAEVNHLTGEATGSTRNVLVEVSGSPGARSGTSAPYGRTNWMPSFSQGDTAPAGAIAAGERARILSRDGIRGGQRMQDCVDSRLHAGRKNIGSGRRDRQGGKGDYRYDLMCVYPHPLLI